MTRHFQNRSDELQRILKWTGRAEDAGHDGGPRVHGETRLKLIDEQNFSQRFLHAVRASWWKRRHKQIVFVYLSSKRFQVPKTSFCQFRDIGYIFNYILSDFLGSTQLDQAIYAQTDTYDLFISYLPGPDWIRRSGNTVTSSCQTMRIGTGDPVAEFLNEFWQKTQTRLWEGIELAARNFWKLSMADPCSKWNNVVLRISLLLALEKHNLMSSRRIIIQYVIIHLCPWLNAKRDLRNKWMKL